MKRSHTDVLFALLDYERKTSKFFKEFFTELNFDFGCGWARADLVIIEEGRSVAGRRGKTVSLYEVKTEETGLSKTIFDSCKQVSLYQLGISKPLLFIRDKIKAEILNGSLAFSVELVIPEKLLEEVRYYPQDYFEKLKVFLQFHRAGILAYTPQMNFYQPKGFPLPITVLIEELKGGR